MLILQNIFSSVHYLQREEEGGGGRGSVPLKTIPRFATNFLASIKPFSAK